MKSYLVTIISMFCFQTASASNHQLAFELNGTYTTILEEGFDEYECPKSLVFNGNKELFSGKLSVINQGENGAPDSSTIRQATKVVYAYFDKVVFLFENKEAHQPNSLLTLDIKWDAAKKQATEVKITEIIEADWPTCSGLIYKRVN